MSSQGRRGGRQGSRAGLGTSSGRPMTGRPMTASVRPGTSAGAARLNTGKVDEQYEEEYDDEDYESEDDGDVFAFVPPDLGPAPEVVQTSEATAAQQQQVSQQSSIPEEEEETFYYDEATGAVYDAQGRLVEMPSGFDASAIQEQQQQQPPQDAQMDHPLVSRPLTAETVQASPNQMPQQPSLVLERSRSTGDESGKAPPYRARSFEDPANGALRTQYSQHSLERRDSSHSSVNKDVSIPILKNAKSISGFPAMDALPEGDASRNHTANKPHTPSRPISRDVGLTVTNAPQLDQRRGSAQSNTGILPSHNTMRQRNNRLSQFADAGQSPTAELKFNLDSASYEDLDDVKYRPGSNLGMIDNMIHTNLSFQGPEVGSKGLRMVEMEMETEEDSPYPEVRASVSNIDDPDMPVCTIRAFFLAFILSTVAGGVNMLLNMRLPAPTLVPLVMLLVAYPCGKLMAAVLPIRTWTLPRWLGGMQFSLNPGMFNIKEHTLITIVLNVSIAQAYALSMVIAMNSPVFYNSPRPIGFSFLFTISSQLIGFCLAGFSRRFLVTPASMIWPQNLVLATILNTLHAEEDGADGTMTRYRYFSYVIAGATLWYFVPGFLFTGLSSFGFLTWIWPSNPVVNVLFGTNSGLGLSVLTFDWNQVTYTGSPLVYPWWAEVNIIAGFLVLVCLICPILYFTNSLNTAYLPFNASSPFDRFGNVYNITRVITPETQLDVAAYQEYSSLYLSPTYLMLFISGFALVTAVLTHTLLYHGKMLWRGMRNAKTEEDDIHAKFMRRYPEVPEWWYAAIGVSMFVLSIITIEVYNTSLPVWALLISLLICVIYILPVGFVFAMTGSVIGTNLVGELVAGYLLPGNAIGNQMFKVYTVQTSASALNFIQDLKLCHYMKVPPRISFAAQVIFSFWVLIVQLGVQQFMLTNVPGICEPDQPNHFTCPAAKVFYTSSVFWGAIGPDRLFHANALYAPLYWSFLIGAVLPLPFWFLSRKYPGTWLKYISVPIALNGIGFIPPASGLSYTSWFGVAFVFQYLIRKYNFRWWSKYNFVTSAALDSGTIISTILVFLALGLADGGNLHISWWGNNVMSNNLDAIQSPYIAPPELGFAPSPNGVM